MRSLAEQNHYEVLEVAHSALPREIERAYQILKSTYATGSLALYSVFDEEDSSALEKQIDIAYRVLSDADARRTYDEEVARREVASEQVAGWGRGRDRPTGGQNALDQPCDAAVGEDPDHDRASFEADAAEVSASRVVLPGSAEFAPGIEGFQDLEGDSEEGEEFDGPRLRRARLRRGIEIDQIADVTKVSATFLLGIEEEAFDDLPAPVYVRGFLIAYARAIGLDARKVAASYMARVEQAKQAPRKSRLLGRH